MQMGGVDQISGKDMLVRETTTINQWQRIRAKGSNGKGFKASMQNCLNKVCRDGIPLERRKFDEKACWEANLPMIGKKIENQQ